MSIRRSTSPRRVAVNTPRAAFTTQTIDDAQEKDNVQGVTEADWMDGYINVCDDVCVCLHM